MKASDVFLRVKDILQDADAVYWPDAELLRWLNDGRLDAYKLRPDLYEQTEEMSLVEGFRQTLPSGSRWLFGVTRNVSSSRQRAITVTDAQELGRLRPNWRSLSKVAEIRHYLYDVRDPSHFDVYPPAKPDVKVEISYAKLPEVVTNTDTELTQEGEFSTALVDYVAYRCFLKEADTVPAFHQRAAQHLQIAQATLTGNVQTKVATSPSQ